MARWMLNQAAPAEAGQDPINRPSIAKTAIRASFSTRPPDNGALPFRLQRSCIFQEASMTAIRVSQDAHSQESEVEACVTESPVDAAEAAGLRYVTDASPGIRRRRRGKHFSYLAPDGKIIQNPKELERIKDVNDYLHEITGQNFTAKDFRAWGGSVLVMHTLKELGEFTSETQAKKNVVQAIKVAAEHLNNTTAICRKCYVHPGIVNSYMDGSLLAYIREQPAQAKRGAPWELHPDEALFLKFLLSQQEDRGN
jgi:DNA topoisomerase IB